MSPRMNKSMLQLLGVSHLLYWYAEDTLTRLGGPTGLLSALLMRQLGIKVSVFGKMPYS